MRDGFNIRNCIAEGEMDEAEINHSEFWVTVNRVVRLSGKHNFEGAQIPVNTNWNLEKMEEWLEGYEDKQNVIQYLKYGWPLNAKETEAQKMIPSNQSGAKMLVKSGDI